MVISSCFGTAVVQNTRGLRSNYLCSKCSSKRSRSVFFFFSFKKKKKQLSILFAFAWVNFLIFLNSDLTAVCLDGSPPAYHWDRGFGTGINSWLIQLEVCPLVKIHL